MSGVVTGNKDLVTKQIEVHAGGASDVKIVANGASQKVNAGDKINSDNTFNQTQPLNSLEKFSKSPFDMSQEELKRITYIKNPSIFSPDIGRQNPYGNFDINGDGQLDDAELAAMQAYTNAQKAERQAKGVNSIDELLKILGIGIELGKLLANQKDKENEFDINKSFKCNALA